MSSIIDHIDRTFLAAVAGRAPAAKKDRQAEIIIATAAILPRMMDQFEINTAQRIEQFVCQVAHECDGFCTTREYADGSAYEGRQDLGNTMPGDGKRFCGRGEIQLTGRKNARLFTIWMRRINADCPDFEQQPELLETFPWAVWSAIYFWTINSLNVLADRNDLLGITRRINGGKNGLDDRARREKIAERLLAAKAAVTPIAADIIATRQNFPVLYRGVPGQDARVEQLQRALQQAGYYHLAIDGDFGAGTEQAVRTFQARTGLVVDGIAGGKTYAALSKLLNITL